MRMELDVCNPGFRYAPVVFYGRSNRLGRGSSRGIVQSPRRNPGFVRKQHSVSVRMNGADYEAFVPDSPSLGQCELLNGSALPFGATARDDGVNFAVYSTNAASASICLMSKSDLQQGKITHEIPLEPSNHKSEDVWHAFLKGKIQDMVYGFKFDGNFSPEDGHYYDPSRVVLDPYAKLSVETTSVFWDLAGMVPASDDEGRIKVLLTSSKGYLLTRRCNMCGWELGVNCIELMPCHEFNELEYYSYNSVSGDYKYSSSGAKNCGRDAINEVKLLIREAHKRGIELKEARTVPSCHFEVSTTVCVIC